MPFELILFFATLAAVLAPFAVQSFAPANLKPLRELAVAYFKSEFDSL
jgi:hypothetical protein